MEIPSLWEISLHRYIDEASTYYNDQEKTCVRLMHDIFTVSAVDWSQV